MLSRFVVAATLLCAVPAGAAEPRLPAGKTCDDVRAAVSHYGKIVAELTAYAYGYSRDEVREARKCLLRR